MSLRHRFGIAFGRRVNRLTAVRRGVSRGHRVRLVGLSYATRYGNKGRYVENVRNGGSQ
jgi:hypothetical protein